MKQRFIIELEDGLPEEQLRRIGQSISMIKGIISINETQTRHDLTTEVREKLLSIRDNLTDTTQDLKNMLY